MKYGKITKSKLYMKFYVILSLCGWKCRTSEDWFGKNNLIFHNLDKYFNISIIFSEAPP